MSTTKLLAQPVEARAKPPRKRAVPTALIRETIDGVPFYYRGYRDVLNKKQTLENIMADSGLQSLLKTFFYDLLVRSLDPDFYKVLVGEVGAHLEHRSNFGLDIAVYEKAKLINGQFGFKFLNVIPKFVVEIDMKVSLDDTGIDQFSQFLDFKTQKLFDSGVEKLIWVISASKKVVVATPGEDWLIVDWNKDIELWQGIKANIGQHLKEWGINADVFGKAR